MQKKNGIVFLAVSIVLLVSSQVSIQAQVIPGQYIVVLKDEVLNSDAVANELSIRHGLAKGHVYHTALKGFSARIPNSSLRALAADPRVNYIEPDLIMNAIQNDNASSDNGVVIIGKPVRPTPTPAPQVIPTGVRRINAFSSSTNMKTIDIAIIDTGVSRTHPDLYVYKGVTILSGNVQEDAGNDDNGHGSHVAGIAAALNNTIGVVGVAPGAGIWAVKVLFQNGSGYLSDIEKGIDWVTSHADEIDVANMSLGGTGSSNSLRTALQNSVNAGIFYAVAAGNNYADIYGGDGTMGTDDDFIPAAYPEVAAISALVDYDGLYGGLWSTKKVKNDDTLASFSNYSRSVISENPVNSLGAAIDVAAPGVNIYSCYKGTNYATMSGTSMASPHVAGVAALYIAKYGRDFNEDGEIDAGDIKDLRQVIIDNSEPQSEWGPSNTRDPDPNHEGLVNASLPE